jgi:hypothetical protein
LVEFEDEFVRRGGFELVYPVAVGTFKFLHCMRSPLYSNLLLAHWQRLTAEKKLAKMKHLEELCSNGVHISRLTNYQSSGTDEEKSVEQ